MTIINKNNLHTHLTTIYTSLEDNQKYWIGLAGSPGSGKSTITAELEKNMAPHIKVLPMDGYHYTKDALRKMDDPDEAFARRGAPFTFDVSRLYKDLFSAKELGHGLFPSFDHSIGDPVENDIKIEHGKQIIIVEGNYLLLNETIWKDLKTEIFHETWFLDVSIELCCERVEKRHIMTGNTPELAKKRVKTNDRLNAILVREASIKNTDYLIQP